MPLGWVCAVAESEGSPGDVGVSVAVPALPQSHRTQTKPGQTHPLPSPKLFLSFGARSALQPQGREMTLRKARNRKREKKAGQEINLLSDRPIKANLPRHEGGKR